MDRLTQQHRSWNMSRIRGRHTKPELAVRSLLHRMGYRFRLHVKSLPGTPDIVLPKYNTAIFVHGCFWHRHRRCRYAYKPKSRHEFWASKFEDNVKRDAEVRADLRSMKWRVVVVWECELRDLDSLANRLASNLNSPPAGRTKQSDGVNDGSKQNDS